LINKLGALDDKPPERKISVQNIGHKSTFEGGLDFVNGNKIGQDFNQSLQSESLSQI
jgi:hypothetical protein